MPLHLCHSVLTWFPYQCPLDCKSDFLQALLILRESTFFLLSPNSEVEELIPEEGMSCFWLAFVLILPLLTIAEIKFKV